MSFKTPDIKLQGLSADFSMLDFTYYTHLLNTLPFLTIGNKVEREEISANLLDSFSVLHTSVPNVKLYYPEPFIATPTFIHDDLWFLHIVIYQY